MMITYLSRILLFFYISIICLVYLNYSLKEDWFIAGQSNITWQNDIWDRDCSMDNLYPKYCNVFVEQFHDINKEINIETETHLTEAKTFSLFATYFGIHLSNVRNKLSRINLTVTGDGSTAISCWIELEGKCKNNYLDRFKGYEFDGFVWWQGETDGINKTDPDTYQKNLEKLIKYIRDFFGNDEMKIIIVAIPGYWDAGDHESKEYAEIRNRQLIVGRSDPYIKIVNARDYTESELHPVNYYNEIAKEAAKVSTQ